MFNEAIKVLKNGGIIAYPTEAVYGLGCDPFNESAVDRLFSLKQRTSEKGLILIAANWAQIKSLVEPIPEDIMATVLATWPGPVTWVFPKKSKAPEWLTGGHQSLALRVTNHPIAKKICELFEGPIVSTSANISNFPPAKTSTEVASIFKDQIDIIISGDVGGLTKPTQIRDALTGKVVRE